MGLDETICRVCLQIIEEEVPFSVLRGSDALLEDLKLVSPLFFNNLDLTEDSSICKMCETTVQELATFKRTIVGIEAGLATSHELDANFVFPNADSTCRLCLQQFESLAKSWRDCEGLLGECDLLLSNIEAPGKICESCDVTLTNLKDFLWTTFRNETLIVDCANKTGILSSKDLFSISSMKYKTEENCVEEPLQVTITKTPNTYQKRRSRCSMPSTSQEPTDQNPNNQSEQMYTCIDVSPARITDVTFGEIADFKLTFQETKDVLSNDNLTLDVVEYEIGDTNDLDSELLDENSTQELVDILEGREIVVAPQEEEEEEIAPQEEEEEIAPQEEEVEIAHQEEEVGVEPQEEEAGLQPATGSTFEGAIAEEAVNKVVTRKRKVKAVSEVNTKRRATIRKVAKVEKSEEMAKESKKPVAVTIIKRAKRSKKAELDKTWQELTGKPNKEAFVQEYQGGVEIQLVNSRRGRPKLMETQRKAITRKHTVWFHCDLCSFKTYSKNSLVAHQLIHNLRGPNAPNFQCNVCPFNSPSAEAMRGHKTNHTDVNLTYKCIFCDDMFKKKVTCMYHTLKHDDQDIASQFYCMVYNGSTEEEFFECYQCFHQEVEEAAMPDHVIGHTVESVKTCLVITYKCDKCQYITKDPDLLQRHKTMHKEAKSGRRTEVKEEPQEETIYKCDKCMYMSKNKRSLSNHKGLKHNRTLPPVEVPSVKNLANQPMYFCNECSYSTHRKINLPRHQLVHRTKKNMEFYECSHCIFETKHRRSYTRHMESVHGLIS